MQIAEATDTADLRPAVGDVRAAFLASVASLRPRLHRFCSRMTGSVLEGEDVVQETLAQAFYSLGALRDPARLEAWLFQIAHHKCVDFIRRRARPVEDTVPYDDEQVSWADDRDVVPEPVDEALATLVTTLPPMERAAVLLKDVLDYRLSEIAEVVDSTVGGVKSALHRGRTKLRAAPEEPAPAAFEPGERALLESYIDRFNNHDWDGLTSLIRSDVRMEIVGMPEAVATVHGDRPGYYTNYLRMPWQWRFGLASCNGEPLVVLWRRLGDRWVAHSAVRIWWRNGMVSRIRDYIHVDYLLRDNRVEPLGGR